MAVAHMDSCDKILDADAWKALDSVTELEEDDRAPLIRMLRSMYENEHESGVRGEF
jgi:hypothetical protein